MGIRLKRRICYVINQKLLSKAQLEALEELPEVSGKELWAKLDALEDLPDYEKQTFKDVLKYDLEDFTLRFEIKNKSYLAISFPPNLYPDWAQDESLIDGYTLGENLPSKIIPIKGSIYPYSFRSWYVLGSDQVIDSEEASKLNFSEKYRAKFNEKLKKDPETDVKSYTGMFPPSLLLLVLKELGLSYEHVYPAVVTAWT